MFHLLKFKFTFDLAKVIFYVRSRVETRLAIKKNEQMILFIDKKILTYSKKKGN